MDKEAIQNGVSTTSLLATTGLGIAGVFTGVPLIQAAAYIPPVAEKIINGLLTSLPDGYAPDAMRNDVETLLHKTDETVREWCEKSDQKSWSNLAKYYQSPGGGDRFDLSELQVFFQSALEQHSQSEGTKYDYSPSDYTAIAACCAAAFISLLPGYPKLSAVLTAKSLGYVRDDLNGVERRVEEQGQRIEKLEKKESTPNNSSTGNRIQDDIEDYSQQFEETLFLHKGLTSEQTICLKDVYTLPAAKAEGYWSKCTPIKHYENIQDALRQFLTGNPHIPDSVKATFANIMFIEGQAAMGKSSLIAWLCWNYCHEREFANTITGSRRVICIRLRNLPESFGNSLNVESPLRQLIAYLTNRKESDLPPRWNRECRRFLRNAVLILEGFDELCMVEAIREDGKNTYFMSLHRELERMKCNCKVIVTTRPFYLEVERIDFHAVPAHISICPFEKKQAATWIQRYEEKTKRQFEAKMKDQLLSVVNKNEGPLGGIIGSPLTIYMIAAKNISLCETTSLWHLYQRIFAEEIYDRNYEDGDCHGIHKYKTQLHQLCAEIANALSVRQHFSETVENLLKDKNIHNLIDKIIQEDTDHSEDENNKIKRILKDCFGLASYFKISRDSHGNPEKAAVEFYHNNIRDFFYCEYIWMSMDRIYSSVPDGEEDRCAYFIREFQGLFQYAVGLKSVYGSRPITVQFLDSKVQYLKETDHQAAFIKTELEKHYFPGFLGRMLRTGILYQYQYTGKDNILQMMICVYSAVFYIYHTIYLIYLEDDEKIHIFEYPHAEDINSSQIFRTLFVLANISDQSRVSFNGLDLSGLEFRSFDFKGASFIKCGLHGCNFGKSELYEADFTDADLENADLRGTRMNSTTIFTGASLLTAKVQKEHLPLFDKTQQNSLYTQ